MLATGDRVLTAEAASKRNLSHMQAMLLPGPMDAFCGKFYSVRRFSRAPTSDRQVAEDSKSVTASLSNASQALGIPRTVTLGFLNSVWGKVGARFKPTLMQTKALAPKP